MNVRFYYHMTLKILKIAFLCENVKIFPYFTQRMMDVITFPENLKTTGDLYTLSL